MAASRSMCWRSWSIAGSSRNRLANVKDMDRDTEQLNLLAIFHYVVAGLAALFSLFPLLYTTIGAIFISVARHGTPKPPEELPPEFLGWIFVGVGSFLFFSRNRDGDLYLNCRPMSFSTQVLLILARDGLHRMSVRSVRTNSWRLHDYRALARVGESLL